MPAEIISMDAEILDKLNKAYVDSVQRSDGRWQCVAAHVTRG